MVSWEPLSTCRWQTMRSASAGHSTRKKRRRREGGASDVGVLPSGYASMMRIAPGGRERRWRRREARPCDRSGPPRRPVSVAMSDWLPNAVKARRAGGGGTRRGGLGDGEGRRGPDEATEAHVRGEGATGWGWGAMVMG